VRGVQVKFALLAERLVAVHSNSRGWWGVVAVKRIQGHREGKERD